MNDMDEAWLHRTIEYPTLLTKITPFSSNVYINISFVYLTTCNCNIIPCNCYITTCNCVILKLLELLMHTVLECKIYRWCLQCKSTNTDIHTDNDNRSYTGQIGRHMYHISHLLQWRLCTYMYKGVHKIAGSWTWNIHVTFNRIVTSYHQDCVLRKIIALFRKNQHFKTSNTRDSDCTETKKSSALQSR